MDIVFFFSLQDGLWGETDWDDVGWATAGDWCNVTSWRELRTLAGAAVIVSVLGAELASSVGEAAGSSSCAAEALGMKAREEKKNEYRNSAKKLSCRCSYSLFKAMLGNLLAAANDSEWKLPPNWLKLSISKVIQSCSAKLNTAQLCLLTRLVCISIIPQDTNRMRLTNWLLTVHFSFVELWFFTASGNIWLYNLVLVNRFLKRAQSDVPLCHRSFFLLRNSVRGGVFLDESLSSSSLNSNKICQFIILQR